jgi:ABC-type amino acid transport substrate-binding protein
MIGLIMINKCIFLFLVVSLFPVNLYAKKEKSKTIVIAFEENWADNKDKGLGVDFLRSIFPKEKYPDINVVVSPLPRALMDFQKGNVDCFMGGDENIFIKYVHMKPLSSRPYHRSSFRIFSLKSKLKIKSVDQIFSSKVAWLRGMDINAIFGPEKKKLNLIEVVANVQGIDILKKGRADYFATWSPVYGGDRRLVHTNSKISFFDLYDQLNCQKSDFGKYLVKEFNKNYIKTYGDCRPSKKKPDGFLCPIKY